MSDENTQWDILLKKLKNHRRFLPILLFVLLVAGTADLLDNTCKIAKFFGWNCPNDSKVSNFLSSDTLAILNTRGDNVDKWFDDVVVRIEKAAFEYQSRDDCNPTMLFSDGLEFDVKAIEQNKRCEHVTKTTFELTRSVKEKKIQFINLHKKYIEHLSNAEQLSSHETRTKIEELRDEVNELLQTSVVGFHSDSESILEPTAVYLDGYPEVILSLRHLHFEFVADPYLECSVAADQCK